MQRKIARLVSFVGNPLVLSVLVACYANFKYFDPKQSLTLTAILVLVGVAPVFFFINQKVKQGNYADHDVSARRKRPSLYVFALASLLLMIFSLYIMGQPSMVINGAWAAWILAALSFVINFKIKTSLHTGYAFLIGFLTLSVGFWAGIALIAFAFLVAWSRMALGRHSFQEVFVGACLGSSIGSLFYGLLF